MKKLCTLLLFCGIYLSAAYGHKATFHKLAAVNKCWTEQKDVSADALPAFTTLTETEWIRTHLRLVETTLRKRSTKHLSELQLRNRLQCLNYLHEYLQTGNFPVNDVYSYRTPIFIDRYDNFCAVGYLVKASGNEHISRMVAAKTNTAYVRQMHYPELNEWAVVHGFSTDELAWIQPGYPPTYYCAARSIGNGVNGHVNELFVEMETDKLFVGGAFKNVDSTITANNIAYVTEVGGIYTWHNMGTGVNGSVHAIAKYDNKIFVAGSFDTAGGLPVSNIAYWDGAAWNPAGCVSGTVYDLTTYDGALYAAGTFSDCATATASNFAKWTSAGWVHIPGINGRINTMEATESALLLGGAFSYDTTFNIVRWSQATSFRQFDNYLKNEVMDLEGYADSLYAACKRTDTADTTSLFMVLRNGGWEWPGFYFLDYGAFNSENGALSLNTLCNTGTTLEIGGQFYFAPAIVPGPEVGYNNFSIGHCSPNTDSAVNKMVSFKGKLIIGGKFNKWRFADSAANGIATREWVPISVPSIESVRTEIVIYPNPIQPGKVLTIQNNMHATHYALQQMTGRTVDAGAIDNKQQVQLPQLPPGIYIITISNGAGERTMQKLQVE